MPSSASSEASAWAPSSFSPSGARGLLVGAVDPHLRARLGAGPFGEPGVIRVRVGEQHRVDVRQLGPEPGQRAREVRPVARCPGVDHGVLAGFGDQVEVRDALRQPVDALAHLHWLASRNVLPRSGHDGTPEGPRRHRTNY
jgi:hypothetical protein